MSTSTPDRTRMHSGSLRASIKKARSVSSSAAKQGTRGDAEATNSLAVGDRAYEVGRPRTSSLSGPVYARTPTRSFYHRAFHGQLEPVQYASEGLREETAEVSSFAYSDTDQDDNDDDDDDDDKYPPVIQEVSEPVTPEDREVNESNMIIPPIQLPPSGSQTDDAHRRVQSRYRGTDGDEANEYTSLLSKQNGHGITDIERQISNGSTKLTRWRHNVTKSVTSSAKLVFDPRKWSGRAIWQEVVLHPVSLLPAVFLGLLLNILDALSYGMILFPLGNALFDSLGSDGIAMFYVSTIVAQLTYSCGGSIFKGGVGSEMIEVVPFFHKMAFTILDRVGEDNPKSVLATTILSYAISSIITGAVFFLMGTCKLGSLIGFFPRHILIGCIGGVGWFLIVTGIEVSARLPGNLEYDLATIKQLIRGDTIQLWTIPLALAITLMIIQRYVKSNFLVGGYFIAVATVFYFFKFALGIQMDTLHNGGWVFDTPPAGNPWYHFYTLYDFKAVHWGALADTIPTMFALTFFGILHVPINVPALGISTGEDNLNVDRELIAHGLSNTLSGLCGSIQNYLVYTNSLLFMDSGGTDRLAGVMLAIGTAGILTAPSVIIGYIPIMVVGALIFLLGIELLEEAVVDTYGKVHKLEYLTILVIVVTMGVYDFVAGILVGIVLAALNFVVQTSQRTAIRAEYTGVVAQSTVRRPPAQLRFLKETGQQISVIKLAGFLFFGTIVSVENRIRALLADDAFNSRPLRFVVLDMININGVDFSAAEAFTRINRLLQKRGVQLIISGVQLESSIGRALSNVGLFTETAEVEAFETLNQALQDCENQLLKALYQQQRLRAKRYSHTVTHLDIPGRERAVDLSQSYRAEFMVSSPRQHALHEAATASLAKDASTIASHRWSAYKQPLPLLMQIFEDLSDKSEDFWHRAASFFERTEYPAGVILFQKGDRPYAFYLVEEGLLRAEYDLPQGKYSELIVEKRPCGELPFFSDTPRTATMTSETRCIVWQLTCPRWHDLQTEFPDLAQELLRISLKLTKERMDAITAYVLTTAG